MTFAFSKTSLERRKGVHPDLIKVSDLALSYGVIDMTVLPDGGIRTGKRQQELVNIGASKTLKSKHLIQEDGYGHAIDLAPYPVDWNDIERFHTMAVQMLRAAKELDVKIEWGGNWPKFRDMPHFQLKS